MGKQLLVDGYNLLHQIPKIKQELDIDAENARAQLLHRLSSYAQKNKLKIIVIFDGHRTTNAPQKKYLGVSVKYSKNESADAIIKRMVDTPRSSEKPLVITSDREIIDFARHCGAKSKTSQEFAKEITTPKPKKIRYENKYDPPMSKREVKEWMHLFGAGPPKEE